MRIPDDASEQYARIVEHAAVGVVQADTSGTMVFVNEQWCRMLGYDKDELLGRTVFDITDPECLNVTRGAVARLQFGDSACVLHKRYRRKDGSVLHATSSASAIRNQAGDFIGLIVFVVDTSEQVHTESQLRASASRLNRALEAGRMNAWDWDLASDTITCSANAQEFWGRPVSRPADFVELIHPDDQGWVDERLSAAVASGNEYEAEHRLRRPDGTERWVHSLADVERDAAGVPLRLTGVTADITERKRNETATRLLADAGETLGASLDYTTTLTQLARVLVPAFADWYAVDLLGSDGQLERVVVSHPDPARVRMARELHERYPARRGALHGAWHVIETGEPDCVEHIGDDVLQNVARDDAHLALLRQLQLRSYICAPLKARGSTIGAITLVYAESGRQYRPADVTLAMEIARRAGGAVDNARLYRELQHADRRKDEFLAMLAHELRNPLAPISTAAQLLRLSGTGDERVRRASEVIARQVEHMTELVDDLLDVSRVTRGLVRLESEVIDLKTVVTAAVEQVQSLIDTRGHALSLRIDAAPLMVEGDRARLIQVLANLLNNAAKYTPPGGEIELAVRAAGQSIRITVTDNGSGIDRALLPHVFELFTQAARTPDRSQGGLGIGLALVRSIVQLHDGDIHAASEGRDRGSTFTLTLPRLPVRSATASKAGGAEPDGDMSPGADDNGNGNGSGGSSGNANTNGAESGVGGAGPSSLADAGNGNGNAKRDGDDAAASLPLAAAGAQRVLLVDDNLDAAAVLAEVLRLQGHDVAVAASAQDALAQVDGGFTPHSCILDIGLPDMTGYELAARLRERPAGGDALFIALTGYGQNSDRTRATEAGFHAHFVKPADVDALSARLGQQR